MNTVEQLQEEIFCLRFELNALSDLLFRGEAERWVPGFLYSNIEAEHLARYQLAKTLVENKKVLDIACGSGLGSYILAKEGRAAEVTGGDINELSLRYARHRFIHPGLTYLTANAEEYFKEKYYDVVVSFETVEHLKKPELFLQNVAKSLSPRGIFCISTPLSPQTNKKPYNPYHTIEWNFGDFQQLIKKYFNVEEIYIQNVVTRKESTHLPARIFKKIKNAFGVNISIKEDFQLFPYSKEWESKTFFKGYQLLVCSPK